MKAIITITFLITLMLMGVNMVNDTLLHTVSCKGATDTTITAGTQDAEMNLTTTGKPVVQSAETQQNSVEAFETLPGKNTSNLIIIL